jgi:hypothetical protein
MFRHFEERRHQEGNKQDSPSYTRLSVSELETIYLLYILLGGTRIFYAVCHPKHPIPSIYQYSPFEEENRGIEMIFPIFVCFYVDIIYK